MTEKKYDFIIIGAGIIGVTIARYLTRYRFSVLLIEKESDIGMGASSANSAIIHSGHDPLPGSLKARLNVRGNKLWGILAKDLKIPFRRTGSYVVAVGEEEFRIVHNLYERAAINGVWGIEVIKKEELLYREPKISPQAEGALCTKSTGVIDPFRAVLRVCENGIMNGLELMLNTSFEDFLIEKEVVNGIKTSNGNIHASWIINASGLFADDIMHKAELRKEFTITPVRGEYLVFDSSKINLNTVLYPVPTEKGKGCLVSTTTHGNVMIGPNAEKVEGKLDCSTTSVGLEWIVKMARKLVPGLDPRDVIAQFAGLRAKGNREDKDFLIEIGMKGLINLGGIESPAFTAAPAIAEYVIELLKDEGVEFREKKEWHHEINTAPPFRSLSHRERQALVEKNPAYGRIICRCEEITEGEILEAIHGLVPATTYDAIKRRTWLGTGRCQGAFDYPRVMAILAEELKLPVTEITKRGGDSRFIFRGTKDE